MSTIRMSKLKEAEEEMEDVKLRKKNEPIDEKGILYGGLNNEWNRRLSEYQFLLGTEKPHTKRSSFFGKIKNFSMQNRRFTITGPSNCSRNNEHVC